MDSKIKAAFVAFAILVVAFFAFAIWANVSEEREWNDYKLSHHCRSVGTKRGGYGYSSNGKLVINQDQTIYQCDDGEMQIR